MAVRIGRPVSAFIVELSSKYYLLFTQMPDSEEGYVFNAYFGMCVVFFILSKYSNPTSNGWYFYF